MHQKVFLNYLIVVKKLLTGLDHKIQFSNFPPPNRNQVGEISQYLKHLPDEHH